jgi:hypothetical protein
MTEKYKITLEGCDDSTYMYVDLSPSEYDLIKRVSDLSHMISTYGCMPTMSIRLLDKSELDI